MQSVNPFVDESCEQALSLYCLSLLSQMTVIYLNAILYKLTYKTNAIFYISYLQSTSCMINMTRQIILGVIQMHKSAVYISHILQHVLQTLANVVAVMQRRCFV